MTSPDFSALPDILPDRGTGEASAFTVDSVLPFTDIAARFAHLPGTVVLASGGASDCARYNILGIDPWCTLRASLDRGTVTCGSRSATVVSDPLDLLQFLVGRYRSAGDTAGDPCRSGFLGYLSYDLKDCIETLPRTSIDDLHLPHVFMAAPSVIFIEDLREKRRTLFVSPVTDDPESRKTAFERTLSYPVISGVDTPVASSLQSCFTREEYVRAVETIRDYIIRGHVYQVNMSQRFETGFCGNPYRLFSLLFERNPAAFFAYINADDHHIISTSPERFIELRGSRVETRPVKGTRPRGSTPEDDARLKTHLSTSPKDDAELSMIVDLLRNDIGKVCREGSVKVREHKRVEAYENVFHMVSIVDGILDNDKDAVDLIRATFPGGSITGCPKIRAMEIIDELEPVRRHVYTGSIGYLSFHGTMDLSIAIRTAIISDGRLVFSVGGGVVYDSDPAEEYEETLHKGKTLMSAVQNNLPAVSASLPVAWCNGRFRPLREIAVPVSDEGFLYGNGIFETIRVQDGKIFRLAAHLERFARSWRYVFGTEAPDLTWDAIITRVLERCGLTEGSAAVRILAAAGSPAAPHAMTLLVTARRYVHRLAAAGRDGLYCIVYPHPRYSHLSDHKTMNYLFYKMANDHAKRGGADEAIIMNPNGSVSESATANLFCIIDGKWYRPCSEHTLPGTMEAAVISELENRNLPVETRLLAADDLKKADQVFLTNALMGIVPVLRLDDTVLPADAGGICADINQQVFR